MAGNVADVNMGDVVGPIVGFSNFEKIIIGKLDNLTMK